MGNTNEEKYEYYVSELEKQIGVFEITVEHQDFELARRLWSELGKGQTRAAPFSKTLPFMLCNACFGTKFFRKEQVHPPQFKKKWKSRISFTESLAFTRGEDVRTIRCPVR
jgi:hypothetical protein